MGDLQRRVSRSPVHMIIMSVVAVPSSPQLLPRKRRMSKSRRSFWQCPTLTRLTLSLFCCFLYFLICFTVAANWQVPLTVTHYESEMHKLMDVVGFAVKPTCVTKRAILALNAFFRPRRIIVVTSQESYCHKFLSFASNVECHAEADLLPGVTKDAIRGFLKTAYGGFDQNFFRGRDSAGWYLQQFLKLGALEYLPDLSEYYLIWDLDMILLKDLSIFYHSERHGRQTILNIGGYNKPGYDASYKNLTGMKLRRAPDGSSFVAHWMVVYKPFMHEFLAFLSSLPQATAAVEYPPWVWAILSALPPDHLHMGFSEYASYASWLLEEHPDSVYVMPKKTWRRHPIGGVYSLSLARYLSEEGLCCPTDKLLAIMQAMQYQYSGFEAGHNAQCHYNDPKYTDGYGI